MTCNFCARVGHTEQQCYTRKREVQRYNDGQLSKTSDRRTIRQDHEANHKRLTRKPEYHNTHDTGGADPSTSNTRSKIYPHFGTRYADVVRDVDPPEEESSDEEHNFQLCYEQGDEPNGYSGDDFMTEKGTKILLE
jgi:hypothetical protein